MNWWRATVLGLGLCMLATMGAGASGEPAPTEAQLARMNADAAAGDPAAQFNLGAYFEAHGLKNPATREDDFARARAWYSRAGDQGQAEALNNLGAMTLDGRGDSADAMLAASYYRRAALLGSPQGETNLALLILAKRTPGTTEEGLHWMKQASDAGFAPAQAHMAQMMLEGVLLPPDDAGAAKLFLSAAQQGDAWGMYGYGEMLLTGTGVPRDLSGAAEWIGRAAEQDLPPALYDYAMILNTGEGVVADPKRANAMFLRAAKLGEPRAIARQAPATAGK